MGFIAFHQEKEESVESMMEGFASQSITQTTENPLLARPHLKLLDADCLMFARIEGLAIAKKFRRRGYAKALLHTAEETIKQEWPTITRIELDVSDKNKAAKRLYESLNFVQSQDQPIPLAMVDGIRYEKQLQQPSYHEEIP